MQRVFGIILLFILISFGVFASIVMRYDVERREVNRQVALLKAQTVLSDTQTKQQIARLEERLDEIRALLQSGVIMPGNAEEHVKPESEKVSGLLSKLGL